MGTDSSRKHPSAAAAETRGRAAGASAASTGAPVRPQPSPPPSPGGDPRPGDSRGRTGGWALAGTVAVMLALLFGGIWLGGHPEDLPGFLHGSFEASRGPEVTAEAIDLITGEYYRPVSRAELANASIAGIIASLGDPFSNYLAPAEYHHFALSGHFSGVGVEVAARPQSLGLLVERVFDSSPAQRAGLRRGDVIVAVDGRPLRGLPAKAARSLIVGEPGTRVSLTLLYGRARHTVAITREVISEPVVASELRVLDGRKLAVVALASFSQDSQAELRRAVERVLHAGARGIVLDLRRNGGGLVSEARLIASVFLARGLIVSLRARTQPPLALTASGDPVSSRVPLVVLVDRGTASAAEIVTAALRDHHRATVVGTHTFGKGVFQELQPLANGGALDITVGEYFTPDGHNLGGGGVKEGPGIAPEVAVPPKLIDTERGLEVALHTLAAKVR